jgi:hypothetical protein
MSAIAGRDYTPARGTIIIGPEYRRTILDDD